MLGLASKGGAADRMEFAEVNGRPSAVGFLEGRRVFVLQLELDGERISVVSMVLSPDKLAGL
jgi:hypothetical protein